MRGRRLPLWTVLAVVLVAALAVGSGLFSSAPPTAAQRAFAIESVLRCPSCQDLSVADSTAPTAVAVRATVHRLLAEGRTDQEIESYLVDRYGSTIVLDPPARGWALLVWLLPLAGGAVAIAVLGTVLYRRRRVGPAAFPDGETAGGRDELEDRRRFLARSLADADAEYLAGDLSDRDYLSLRRRDLGALAAVEARLADPAAAAAAPGAAAVAVASPGTAPDRPEETGPLGSSEEDPPGLGEEAAGGETVTGAGSGRDGRPATGRPGRSRRSRWLLRGAIASFAAALVVAVSLFASDRLPGQPATGSVSLTQSQRVVELLDQAATLENQGQLGQATQLYQSVLAGHPDNEVALAQLGWLEYRTGRAGNSAALMDDAGAKLERATSLDPGDYAASLYLGTVLFQRDANAPAAVGQFQRFLADAPPAGLLRQAAPELRQAYAAAGVPLPPQVPPA